MLKPLEVYPQTILVKMFGGTNHKISGIVILCDGLLWGRNDESIISITAALHAAFACGHTKYLDLDGSFDLVNDVVSGGFTVKDGMMRLTKGPGLGVVKN